MTENTSKNKGVRNPRSRSWRYSLHIKSEGAGRRGGELGKVGKEDIFIWRTNNIRLVNCHVRRNCLWC